MMNWEYDNGVHHADDDRLNVWYSDIDQAWFAEDNGEFSRVRVVSLEEGKLWCEQRVATSE
jgi:hypothetical protein